MQCLTCDLTSICKIYEFVSLQKATADISVNNCRVKRTGSSTAIASNPTETAPVNDLKMRSTENIASVTERIRELSAVPDTDTAETLECPECKQPAKPFELHHCDGCGKEICIGCVTEDSSDKKMYCEPCWDNL